MSHSLRQAVIAELAAKNGHSSDPNFWNSFSGTEWRRTLDWLDISGLALYFWQTMRRKTAEMNLPAFAQVRLGRCYEGNCVRVAAIKQEFLTLNSLFDNAGVEYAVLKGFALVPDYCPDPSLRTQYDHDYLIRPHALARAEAVLQRAGYIPKISSVDYHIAYFPPATEAIPPEKPVGLYSPSLGRPVELHVRLWDHAEERIAIPLPDDFLDHARQRSWEEVGYSSLSDEDALIFQILHAFRHILRNWCRLSTFFEISHFLRQRSSDSGFWIRYRYRAGRMRWVPEASSAVFGLAQRLFGGSLSNELKPQVQSRISTLIDLWVERYGLRGALANFDNSKHCLFLHREFVDGQSDWVRVWRRRLFPFRRPHHLPIVLSSHSSRHLGRRWAQFLYGLRRFKFHAFSAADYAWQYPRWWHVRRVRETTPFKAGRTIQGECEKGGRDQAPLRKSRGGVG